MSLPVPFFAVAEEEPSQSYIDEDEGDVINSLFLDGGDSSDSILNIHTQKAVEEVSAIDERSSSLQHEIVEDTAPMDPLSSHSVQQHLEITGVAVKEDVASPPATFLSQLPSVTAIVHEERRGVVGEEEAVGSGEEVVVNEEEKGDVNGEKVVVSGEEVVVNEEEKGDVSGEEVVVSGEEVVVNEEKSDVIGEKGDVIGEKGDVNEEEKGEVNEEEKGEVNEEERRDVMEEEKGDVNEEEKHDIMEEEKGDGSEEKHDAIEEKNRDVMEEEKHDATKEEQEKEDMKKITVEQTNGTSTTITEQKEHPRQEKHPTPTPYKKKPLHKESKKTIPSMLHKEKTDELLNETQPSRIGLQERLQSRKNEKRSAIDARLSKLGIFGSVTTSDVWSMRWKS